jgi:ferredoxin
MEVLYLEEYPWERIEEAMAKCPKDCIFVIES